MNRIILALTLGLTLPTLWAQPALAQTLLQRCADQEIEWRRLACYDNLAGREIPGKDEGSDNWKVLYEVSEFTDEMGVMIWTETLQPLSCAGDEKVWMKIQCFEGETSVSFDHLCESHPAVGFRESELIEVDMRIDYADATKQLFHVSTDDLAFGTWQSEEAISLISRSFFDRESLLVRFSPYRTIPFTMRFNISGLREVIANATPSCDWSGFR